MNNTFILVFIPFVMICFFVMSKYSNRKTPQTEDGYFLANRNVSFVGLCLTFLATQLGGGVIMGTAEAAYEYGFYAIFYALGLSLGLIALSLGIGSKLREFEISTIPELFEKRCQSPFLRKITSIILISTMFLILCALSVGVRKFLYSLGVESNIYFFILWGSIVAYTSLGGLSAVVKTDAIQISFVLFAFTLTAIGISMSDFTMPSFEEVRLMSVQSQNIPWRSWVIMPLLFVIIGQDMGQRCFAAKCPKTVSRATLVAAVLLFLSALLPLFLGLISRFNDIGVNQSKLLFIVEELTNPVIATMFAISVFFAIVSTADSLLCAISSNIRLDLTKKGNVRVSQLVTILVGISAIYVSLSFNDIIPVMIKGYELSVISLALPILICILAKTPNRNGIICVITIGILTYIFEYFTKMDILLYSIGFSFLVYKLVSYISLLFNKDMIVSS